MNDNTTDILLVEDNEDDIELTLRALKKHNLVNRISVARDGQEALDFIFAKGNYENRNYRDFPKVIFLDLKLPKIDGLEVLKTLKSNEELKVIPVVVMTSSQYDRDVVESYKLGVNSYIAKPVDFVKFSEIISQLGYYWLFLNKNSF